MPILYLCGAQMYFNNEMVLFKHVCDTSSRALFIFASSLLRVCVVRIVRMVLVVCASGRSWVKLRFGHCYLHCWRTPFSLVIHFPQAFFL